jgi:hypothetical protein
MCVKRKPKEQAAVRQDPASSGACRGKEGKDPLTTPLATRAPLLGQEGKRHYGILMTTLPSCALLST